MPIFYNSGDLNLLEPSWPVQACNGIALQASWNVTAHAQKPYFVFRLNGRVQFGRGISSVDYWQPEVWASAVVMLDTPCSVVVWRVLATHSIRQFPLHFPSRGSPCAITFQLDSTILQLALGFKWFILPSLCRLCRDGRLQTFGSIYVFYSGRN